MEKRINIVAILGNGLTVTSQADSRFEAATKVKGWLGDQFYENPFPIVKVFFGNDEGELNEFSRKQIEFLAR